MNYFDLHCDTIVASEEGKKTAVDLSKTSVFENYTQCFAIWLSDGLEPQKAAEKADKYYGYFKEHILNCKGNVFTPLLTVENAAAFGNRLENVFTWKERGVKAVTLTWNGKNALGFGASFPDEGGLTAFGKEAVSVMNECKILCDVSHINRNGFFDCLNLSKEPIIATHSNCKTLCNHERNLDDEQMKALFESGGFLGLCYFPRFLGEGDVFELVYEHIYHALELGGEDLLGFGSDFDGAKMDEKLDSIEKVSDLRSFLESKGFDESLLEKIFYKNCKKFFNNVLHD